MNKLKIEKQTQVIASLVEGNSIRATCRMTGVAKNTIVKLLADLGEACVEYQDKAFKNLLCKHIQCDEIWSFCYAKEKNVPKEKKGQFGYGVGGNQKGAKNGSIGVGRKTLSSSLSPFLYLRDAV